MLELCKLIVAQEHHLQAALSASQAAAIGGKVAQIYIPTPDATQSSIQYDKLYPLVFSQPATYIRFSSTVEDCTGCPYDLDEKDEDYLKSLNKSKNASTRCSEDQFEEVMNCFEETAQMKQPYSAVDSPPVLPWDEVEPVLEENLEENAKRFAKEVYDYWKARRIENGNKSLIMGLKVSSPAPKPPYNEMTDIAIKFETGAETDDADPYVCFRRREVRQIRKTRGRDAHSAEKLKKLRKELEEARELLAMIRQREITKKESLATDRQLFEQRSSLRNVKQNLPDQFKQGDEDLLINQKVRTIRSSTVNSILKYDSTEKEAHGYCASPWLAAPATAKARWSTSRSGPVYSSRSLGGTKSANSSRDRGKDSSSPRMEQGFRRYDKGTLDAAARRRHWLDFSYRNDRVFTNTSCVGIFRAVW